MSALYCSEGNQHVKRPSSRVTQPPGGASSIVFGDHTPAEPIKRRQPHPAPEKPKEVLVNTTNLAAHQQQQQQQQQQYQQSNVESSSGQRQGYDTLLCTEGNQLRTRPAKKILQPPGGSSSIFN